ncbi:hypothetical protein [Lachnospira eligens]|uniref:hypothetical protein n=1 Tax=Lachnospira eligens TaxID=39485 RepID=UPI000E5CC117|nr:hypothetical protein [Lachnospira eligens]RGZ73642.1 hypothetical protein DW976_02045 [Lachnospira eligens]
MNADYYLKLKIFGDEEQIKGMLEIVGKYDETGIQYFRSVEVNEKSIDFSNIPAEVIASESVIITAKGPYGDYYELNDVSIFRDLAEAFPQGKFIGNIDGCGTYESQSLDCELKDGMLYINTCFESSEGAADAWKEDVMEKLPLEKFNKLYKIKGENYNEEDYKSLWGEIGCLGGDWASFTLEEFKDCLKYYEQETELEEEEFEKIQNETISELGIESFDEFESCYDGSFEENLVYDPVKKSYV